MSRLLALRASWLRLHETLVHRRQTRALPQRAIRFCRVEALEARIAPATIVSYNTSTHKLTVQGDFVDDGSQTTQAGAEESLDFSISGGNLVVSDLAGHHVTLGTGGAGLTQTSTTSVSVALTNLTGDIQIDTGTGATDQLNFHDTLTLSANGNFAASSGGGILTQPGSTIATSGTGTLSLTATSFIALTGSLATVDGSLTLSANEQATRTGGAAFNGIELDNSQVGASGIGQITLMGKASADGTGIGVYVHNGSAVTGGTAGTLIIQGTGGGGGSGAIGVDILDSGTVIKTLGANVQISGFGGSFAGTSQNPGVAVDNGALVESGPTGNVSVNGTAGLEAASGSSPGVVITSTSKITSGTGSAGTGGSVTVMGTGLHGTVGVFVNGGTITAGSNSAVTVSGSAGDQSGGAGFDGVLVTNGGLISTGGGDLAVSGTGDAFSGVEGSSHGVEVSGQGMITAGGTGNVSVTGIGSAGAGGSNHGIFVHGSSSIQTGGGALTLTGTAGGAGDAGQGPSTGLVFGGNDSTVGNNTSTVGTGAPTTTLISDSLLLNADGRATATNDLFVQAQTAGVPLNLGTSGGFNTLGIDTAALAHLSAPTIHFQDPGAGGITVSAALSLSHNLALTSAGNIDIHASVSMLGGAFLSADAAGVLTISGGSTTISATSTGAINLTGESHLVIGAGTTLSVVDGGLNLFGNAGGAGNGNFAGVDIDSSTLETTGQGGIGIIGQGGTGGTSSHLFGIYLHGGSAITSTQASAGGGITLTGTGGSGSGSSNYGVEIGDTAGTSVQISTTSGAILITGTGGAASGGGEVGINILNGGQIASTGSGGNAGSITLSGTGGSGANSNIGISISQSINGGPMPQITTVDGTIQLIGVGTAGNSANRGIQIDKGLITASGVATITLNGTGGAGLFIDEGIFIGDTFSDGTPSKVSSVGGQILFTGHSGDTRTPGVEIATGGAVSAQAVTLQTDSLDVAGDIQASSASITVLDAGISIDLGGADSATTLGLSQAEIGHLTIGNLTLNSASDSAIKVSQAISFTSDVNLHLEGGSGGIDFHGGSITTLRDANSSVELATAGGGVITTENSGNDITTTTVTLEPSGSIGGNSVGSATHPLHFTSGFINTFGGAGNGDQYLSGLNIITSPGSHGLDAGTGTVHLLGGTFTQSANDQIADASILSIEGAEYDAGHFTDTIGGLVVDGGGSLLSDIGPFGGINFTSLTDYHVKSGLITAGLAGSVGLLKDGTDQVVLAGAMQYSGNTVISSGTLTFQEPGGLGTGTIILNDANTDSNNTTLLDQSVIDPGQFTNPIQVANFGTGKTTIQSSAAAHFGGSIDLEKAVTISVSADPGLFLDGVVSGNPNLITVTGGGRLTLAGSVNSFNGDIHVTGTGTALALGTTVAGVPASTGINIDSGAFLYLTGSGTGASINALSGAGTVQNDPNGGAVPHTLTVAAGGGTGSFSGLLKDGPAALSLTIGGGSQTLTGTSTYTGTTLISNGNLKLGANASLASALIDIQSGNLKLDSSTVAQKNVIGVDGFNSSLEFHSGIIKFTVGGLQGAGNITLANDDGTPVTLSVGQDNVSSTYAGSFDGNGSLVKIGTNSSLILSGTSISFTGTTSVAAGSIVIANPDALNQSTFVAVHPGDLAFATAGTVDLGGLTGRGPIVLTDNTNSPVALHVGFNNLDTTYAGSLSGLGSLAKDGLGTLTLLGKNVQNGSTTIDSGILEVGSDSALGAPGATNVILGNGGILHAIKTFSTNRNIFLEPGTTSTFEADSGKTLTLAGDVSGAGNLALGTTGTVNFTGTNTATGSTEVPSNTTVMVNQVSVSTPGAKGQTVTITPDPTMPGVISSIDLSSATKAVSLVVKATKNAPAPVVESIMIDAASVTAVTLGKGVTLGDGMDDGPDLTITGKVAKASLDSVAANSLIQFGTQLSDALALKNRPNLTLGGALGAGLTIDASGDSGTGGGGLGKVVANSWSAASAIKTLYSIKSITIKAGDFGGDVTVGSGSLGASGQLVFAEEDAPIHHGLNPSLALASLANVGPISIPQGSWTGTGMQVDGIVAKLLTKGLSEGTTLQAGAFGAVSIKGDYDGHILGRLDAGLKGATGGISSVAIAGNFTGVIDADGSVGNVTVSGGGRFEGSLHGDSIGNITAFSFLGSIVDPSGPHQTITADKTIGNITANGTSGGNLTDYIIAAGVNLGHDLLFNGVDDHYTSTYQSGNKVLGVKIGNVTVNGSVSGTTLAAGVIPGTDTMGSTTTYGIFAGTESLAAPTGTPGPTVKTSIGALKFEMKGTSVSSFSGDGMSLPVDNAIEAQTLSTLQFGAKKAAGKFLSKPMLTTDNFIDDGSEATVIRML